jgi:peroxiredoxin
MKARLLLVLLLAAAVGYFLYVYEGPEGVRVGNQAPEFTLPGRGEAVSLEGLRGKVVLLNFWATWCPPCVSEMPSLDELRKRLEGEEFQVLAVSVDEAGWEAVNRFLTRVPVGITILIDVRGDVSALYGTYQLPESYLIGRDGRILKKYVGPRDWMEPSLVAEIESYVRGSQVN